MSLAILFGITSVEHHRFYVPDISRTLPQVKSEDQVSVLQVQGHKVALAVSLLSVVQEHAVVLGCVEDDLGTQGLADGSQTWALDVGASAEFWDEGLDVFNF